MKAYIVFNCYEHNSDVFITTRELHLSAEGLVTISPQPTYEGKPVNRSQMEKTAVMEVIGSVFVSLGSSTVQLYDSLGSRCTLICSDASFGSQNGDSA
jgi:hypothetical protein